jgi:spermidine synthase
LDQIAARFRQLSVERAVREIGIDSPAALLATYITDRDGLISFAGNFQAVTDDQP